MSDTRQILAVVGLSTLAVAAAAGGATPYDFGNPSAIEELMRQAIQRARNDPEAEADAAGLDNTHAHDVPDGTYDIGEGITNAGVANQANYWARYHGPRQYLAWSRPLLLAARNHADDMHTHSFFSHWTGTSSHGYTGGGYPDGDDPGERGFAEGYANHFVGENIAANDSVGAWDAERVHTQQFFTEPDVADREHRRNMLHSYWREIGVGYVVGPPNEEDWTDLWAVDFGSDAFASRLSPDPPPWDPWPPIDTVYVTGVLYTDASGDDAYQVGEQAPGRRVFVRTVGGPWLKHYAVTAAGGGYAVPLLDAGDNDLAAGAGIEVIFFDPAARTRHKAVRTIQSGNVVFEDTADETPDSFPQRFNLGLDARTAELTAVLIADANFDDAVNVLDLAALANHYGHSGREWIDGDFTNDGIVNVLDLAQLANHYGQTVGSSTGLTAGGTGGTAVPAPATLVLLAVGACALRRRKS